MKKIIYSILLLSFFIDINGQKVYHLDLEKSIEIAKEQSFRMKVLNQNLNRSGYELQAATREFRTKVNMNIDGPYYNNSIIKHQDDSGNFKLIHVDNLTYKSTLSISQPLPTDGSISINSSLENSDNFISDDNTFELNTDLRIDQPIQAFYAYNRIRSEFKRAKLNYEAAEKNKKREELNLIYDISQIFYNLLNAQLKKDIAYQVLTRQMEAFDIAENKYAAGLIREVEALQIEVDLGQAQNDYDLSIANYESQSNFFKQSLGIELRDSIVLESEMAYTTILIDKDKAIEHGLNNRQEVREREIDIELFEIRLKQQKAEGLISGNLYATYGLQGQNKDLLPIGFGTSFQRAYNTMSTGPNSYSFGMEIRIPIIDWGENRSRVKALKATQQMNVLELEEEKITIEREIRNTINQLESALRRLQLLEKNVQLAEKSFEISNFRFKNGDIDSEALALDRERLSKTRLSHLEAFISYKLLIADLARKTFYDFEKDLPIL